ncbi:TatD DNase family protein [Dyadobacter koreensis]|uniref:TatD DNase family protein n=1 Tax=Dyadobacter koreensis TaxID=408657 RepID=A0A1H6STL9_9BACT|nr:Qat anti-phage system TatD family nuclease QatD [Dyadobacter koreensis]SEI70226.1 TatD DNase family protein [Dyadobacter koreensis]
MSTIYIDTHCHLDLLKEIDKNPTQEDRLPIKSISVTNAPFLFKPNTILFAQSKNIRISLGLHPELVSTYHDQIDIFKQMLPLTKYVGEVGLDGSIEHRGNYMLQKKVFEEILVAAGAEDNKILTVHSRNAANETIELIHKHLKNTNCQVIFHWFSGNINELRSALKYGFYFSFNHRMVTSKKGQHLIAEIPKDAVLTESDAPFTFNNKIKNRLDSIKFSVKEGSKLYNIQEEEFKSVIYNNFKTMLLK